MKIFKLIKQLFCRHNYVLSDRTIREYDEYRDLINFNYPIHNRRCKVDEVYTCTKCDKNKTLIQY